MASCYQVELKVISASRLKNVNWKHGPLRPYVVAWLDVDPSTKFTTSVAPLADSGPDGEDPVWEPEDDPRTKVVIPVPYQADLDAAVLLVQVVHDADPRAEEEGGGKVKSFVGSAKIPLRDVLDDVGLGERAIRSVRLNRSSGRPQGVLQVRVCVKEPPRSYYNAHPPPPAAAPPYSGNAANASRDAPYAYAPPVEYPYGYGAAYGSAAPPPTAAYGGYGYAAPPPTAAYGGYGYGAPPPSGYPGAYGAAPPPEKKKSKFGVGTGVAVGAAAGLLGGLALAEGIDHIKDDIADDVAGNVEDDLANDSSGSDDDY